MKRTAFVCIFILAAGIVSLVSAKDALSQMKGGMHHQMDAGTMQEDSANIPGHSMEKGSMGHQDMSHNVGEAETRQGKLIHKSMISNYRLEYRLIDMKALMEKMHKAGGEMMEMNTKNMASHHLMVFVTGPDNIPVTDAKVGFLVKGPSGDPQKAMCMMMGNGFGANVDLAAPGKYTIKAKAVINGKKLIDEFSYTMPEKTEVQKD